MHHKVQPTMLNIESTAQGKRFRKVEIKRLDNGQLVRIWLAKGCFAEAALTEIYGAEMYKLEGILQVLKSYA